MSNTLDYTRWAERPLGVAYRRWVIASTGLRHLFRTRFFRILLVVAWASAIVVAAAGFTVSQSISSGGWLEQLAASFGPRPQAVMAAFTAFVLLYPDVVVQGLFSGIFWGQASIGLVLSLVAVTVLVPRLVALDRASHALTIYLARPLTSLDYLLGKFGIVVGVLLVVWTGPLLFGWTLSVLFAADRLFIVHSLGPLLRALTFNGVALVVLAAIAFGVSSLAKTARAATLLWVGLWLLLGTLASIPDAPAVLRHASFSRNLRVMRDAIFGFDEALIRAGESLPFLNQHLARELALAGERLQPQEPVAAAAGLVVLVILSSLVFLRRLRAD